MPDGNDTVWLSQSGEGDVENAKPLDRFVTVTELFKVSKSALFQWYNEERVLLGGFTL